MTRVLALIVVVWALVSVATTLGTAWLRPPDPVAALEAEFRTFARAVPRSEAVGFLPYDVDDIRADHLFVYYVAQYAFAPRPVDKRTDRRFLIVARGALRPGVDDRLAAFERIASSKEGDRLYQRRER